MGIKSQPIRITGKPLDNKTGFFGYQLAMSDGFNEFTRNVEDVLDGRVGHEFFDGKIVARLGNFWEDGIRRFNLTINYFSASEIAKKHGGLSPHNLVLTANEFDVGIFIKGMEKKDKINLVKSALDGYFILGANRYNGYGVVTFFEKYPWNRKNEKHLESLLKRGVVFTSGGAADPSSSLRRLLEKRTGAVDS